MAKRKNDEPAIKGDILGLSDDTGSVKLPHPPSDGSVPSGIDVRHEPPRHWGAEDLERTKGAAGVDMGGGGEGTDVAPDTRRTAPSDED